MKQRRIYWSDVKTAMGSWPRIARPSVEKTDLVIKLHFRTKQEALLALQDIQTQAGIIKQAGKQ